MSGTATCVEVDVDELDFGNLVLSRCVGESIQIGNDIQIEVVRISGAKARLRIRAPKNVPIKRSELLGSAKVE